MPGEEGLGGTLLGLLRGFWEAQLPVGSLCLQCHLVGG